VIGSSKGFGLASRIVSTFGAGADTIGVFSGKTSKGKRTASAGWYNTVAFEQAATKAGYYAKSVNGDAFSNEVKDQVIELIKQELKQVDLVIYSLAALRRIDSETGDVFQSFFNLLDRRTTLKQ
jgi:enoyl-[acyl-carrier protein] reductase/trans-2-enoyl-CoA reductase (NAD+)